MPKLLLAEPDKGVVIRVKQNAFGNVVVTFNGRDAIEIKETGDTNIYAIAWTEPFSAKPCLGALNPTVQILRPEPAPSHVERIVGYQL